MEVIKQLKDAVYQGDDPSIICDLIIQGAVEMSSSDVHVEPLENIVRVRYRTDGVLREIVEYQHFMHAQISARYKILAHLKMDESRKPQDGRISREIGQKELDLRVSTLPTVHGEKIVMRIVDKSSKVPPLSVLGIEWKNGRVLERWLRQPNGIILTSGPTGSGKSTTLYSAMTDLNTPEVNIMTLEDPVENVVDGINQSQVFPNIGYTFASGLRTALRQDPDIIMVGEIRDKETIEIAVEASLTGHLVLSTIHTNSAAETITRILNMGVQAFLLPASVNAIIAQRLVRRLCDCKKKKLISELDTHLQIRIKQVVAQIKKEELSERLDPDFMKNPHVYEPVGCDKCLNEWYKGRVGVYEIMEITPKIKEMILSDVSSVDINDVAVEEGMVSLEQDGMIKAFQGHTSLEEAEKIVKTW